VIILKPKVQEVIFASVLDPQIHQVDVPNVKFVAVE
jgi:hypothetical protein